MSVFRDLSPDDTRGGALERLRVLVELESPSSDETRLRAVAGAFARQLTAEGGVAEMVEVPGVGQHVVGRFEGADPSLEPVVLLGHLDTVHPVGSFQPAFRLEQGLVWGPGCYDMKGGWACVLEALSHLRSSGSSPRRPVLVVATCDEETGSEDSRELINGLATGAHAVLVPEPSLENGGVKTRRKGVGWYKLDVDGRASHAGIAPEAGINAVVELAHQILALHELSDAEAGTTVSTCLVHGGSAANVIPASARAEVDVRFSTRREGERVDRAIRSLRPVRAEARLTVSGGLNRPPMERTDDIAALYAHARRLAAEDGWDLAEGSSGGASDGSLTAGMGVPTLDGLGPLGGGAHTREERVLLEDLGRRVRLYGRLLETL